MGRDRDGKIDDHVNSPCSSNCGLGFDLCVLGARQAINAPQTAPKAYEGSDNDCNGLVDEDCPPDENPPVVSLALTDGFEIKTSFSVVGTATDAEFLAEWVLEVAVKDSDEWKAVARGSENVENAELGILDPTIMTGGIYEIRLRARDGVGNEAMSDTYTFLVLGQRKVGQFSFAFEDVTVPMQGIPVTVTRSYDSFDKTVGDFGVGWKMALGAGVRIQRTKPLGKDWHARTIDPVPWGGHALETENPAKVLVTYADGTQDRFEVRARFVNPWFPDDADLYFEPIGKTRSRLYPLGDSMLRYEYGMLVDLVGDPTVPYDPDQFLLVTQEGYELAIWRSKGLKSITDPSGNTVYFGNYGIIHSTGFQVFFERDGQGRISRIYGQDIPEVRYAYDEQGDLATFTDQAGETWTYGYDGDHNLVSVLDPGGIEVLISKYDDEGRLVSTADGFGKETTVTHDIENVTEIITDPNGNTTRYVYDEDGYITREIGPDGSVKEFSYDGFDNKLSETLYDDLGTAHTTTWSYVYDGTTARVLEKTETDPMSHAAHWTYDERGNVLTENDADGNVTTNEYDSGGNLTRVMQTVGGVEIETLYSYDAGGNLQTIADAEGSVTQYTYDSYGNLVSQLDAEGHLVEYSYDGRGNKLSETETVTTDDGPVAITTTYDYDDANQLVRTIDPEGRITATEYNSIGKRSATIDPDGRKTEFFYDVNGNLVRTLYFDGTEESFTYDGNGNKLSFTDKPGRTITYAYDELDRLVKTTYPDENISTTEYDLLGQVKAEIDADGSRTEYEYDAAGRKVLERNALGQETTFEYDAAGNLTTVTGPDGNAVDYIYDELNRRVETVFPDESFETAVYDNIGMLVARTDPMGRTTQYEYDGVGRLTRVIDALFGETTYAYDERGNKLSQTDAKGQTTTWGYDLMGRRVRRTLPLGMSESWTYDERGLEASHTDFNGETTYSFYNDHGRLEEMLPGGSCTG